LEVAERVQQLLLGDRSALARTVTLIESSNAEHRSAADKIMAELLKQNKEQKKEEKTMRIGFCGAPGAGKSSLIEKFGIYLTQEQK